jgi:hypothetical protein
VGSDFDAMFVEQSFCFFSFLRSPYGNFNAFFGFLMEITLKSQKPPTFSNFIGRNFTAKNKTLF